MFFKSLSLLKEIDRGREQNIWTDWNLQKIDQVKKNPQNPVDTTMQNHAADVSRRKEHG